jgi:hypothetical protein
MKVAGCLDLSEATNNITNLIVPNGPAFPTASPKELFYLTQDIPGYTLGMYLYKDGAWVKFAFDTETIGFQLLHGFKDRNESTLTYNESTRTLSISPVSTAFYVYIHGVLYSYTVTISLQHTDVTGMHFFFFNSSGQLTVTTTEWNILQTAPCCAIYYNSTTQKGISIEERHGSDISPSVHARLHFIDGTQVMLNEFLIADYVLSTANSNTDVRFSITGGSVFDEDIRVVVSALTAGSSYFVMYRSGAGGAWSWVTSSVPASVGTTFIHRNLNSSGTWSQSELANGDYTNYYVMVIPALDTAKRIVLIEGQHVYTTLSDAQQESVANIDWGTIPFSEIAPLYKITLRCRTSYNGTTGKFAIESVERLKGGRSTLSLSGVTTLHNSLSGRSTVDAHPASAITVTPVGNIAATNTQAAIAELDSEKAAYNHDHTAITGTAAKLTTPVVISLTGDVSGQHSFDGSGDISISTTFHIENFDLISSTSGTTYDQLLVAAKTAQASNITAGSGTVTVDYSNGDMVRIIATKNITITFSNLPVGFVSSMILVCVDFGGHTITWPVGMTWSSGAAPAFTTTGVDYVSVIKDASGALGGFLMGRDCR